MLFGSTSSHKVFLFPIFLDLKHDVFIEFNCIRVYGKIIFRGGQLPSQSSLRGIKWVVGHTQSMVVVESDQSKGGN